MIRPRPKRWTHSEHSLLLRRRSEGVPYSSIAFETGHTEASCRTTHKHLKSGRIYKTLPPRKIKRDKVIITIGMPTEPDPVTSIDHARSTMSLARLQADAELRNRIATMGITAGLMGDPRPGRSALDRKLAETAT